MIKKNKELKVLENNIKGLILLDLNEYNYGINYVNTKTTVEKLNSYGISVDQFVSDMETRIKEEVVDLYCDLKLSTNAQLPQNNIIIKIEKNYK